MNIPAKHCGVVLAPEVLQLEAKAGILRIAFKNKNASGEKMLLLASGTSDGIFLKMAAETNRVGATCHRG